MDIIQGLIETGNAGKPGWRIVNNGGAIGVFNNRTSNVLFSILNDGGIGTSSNVSSTFINSYSGINVSNYTGTGVVSSGGTGGTGVSSQWTTAGVKIYYTSGTSGNIGIGTIDPIAPLHIYNTSNTRLLLDATTTGTATVEFRRGTGVDALNDYRFINDSNGSNGSLKLQYENTAQSFGNTVADLAWFSSNETIIHKNTTMNGRVGIGTVYHATRTLDVFGDANISGMISTSNFSVSSNAVLTNSITSNTSLTIHNGLLPPLPNVIAVVPLASEIVVAGTTSGIIGADRVISFPYSGSGNTKDYTFTTTENLICDILIVGGGGSGSESHGGGGGAGAVIFMTNVTMNGGYTIKVGKGGVCEVTSAGLNGLGRKGNDSEIFKTNNISNKVVAEGGGGGGQFANANGGSGGSGGGGDAYNVAAGVGGAATPYTPVLDGVTGIKYGNNGGNAFGNPGHGGGGGGAGGVGENALVAADSGNAELERAHGGLGIKSATINSVNYDFKTLFGTNTGGVLEADGFIYFGGGGGNGRWRNNNLSGNEGGNGGLGGGGKGGWGGSGVGTVPLNGKGYPGINGTGGGGGGGADYTPAGGDGGSGIVIIRYRKPPADIITETISGIVGTADRYTIFPYTGTGTTKDYSFTTTESLSCDILVVGGGGGGGKRGGAGGGAGACLYHKNVVFNTQTFIVSVGKGGLYGGLIGEDQGASGSTGSDSSISVSGITRYLAKGGGGGQGGGSDFNTSGGSSGGGNWGGIADGLSTNNIFDGSTVSVVSNQYQNTLTSPEGCRGNIGGNQLSNYRGGGGGGAGSAGMNHDPEATTNDGYGGLGISIDITGTPVVYAGGGNGSDYSAGQGIEGGSQIQSFNPAYPTIQSRGGGGFGSDSGTAQNGLDGTGGGGGGQGTDRVGFLAGSGGSGIVIVRYRKLPNEIVVAGTTSTVIGATDRCISFPYTSDSAGLTGQTQYTFTTTEALSCDILVVGGGGGGSRRAGGGGGAGALIYTTSMTLQPGINIIRVGNGGVGSAISGNVDAGNLATTLDPKRGRSGFDSEIYYQNTSSTPVYRAKGGSGGLGGNTAWPPGTFPSGQEPLDGGSGGGNGARDDGAGGLLSTLNIVNGSLVSVINNIASDSVNPSYVGGLCFGNEGGRGAGNSPWLGSGGGGAGTRGTDVNTLGDPSANNVAGIGGAGKVINITGSNIVYAGGGGGGNYSGGASFYNDGGSGGGGRSGTSSVAPIAGTNGTGGGGGGDGPDVFNGGAGGSGIVIIRYRLPSTTSSSSINFIRGTVADMNHDYRVGNFNGEFKVISSVTSGTSNIDTDYIRITTSGAITNPAGTANWNIGSDRRIKENIERASYDKCFENINRLELNRFNYVSEFNTVNRDKTQLGFIAQEVYDVFPKSISTQGYYSDTLNIPDLLSIDISQINYSLYGAVKKLIEINNEKDGRLKELDDELKTIETILNITPEADATSNVVLEETTSNVVLEETTSNVVLEEMTSNVILEEMTSNVINVVLEEITSNITVDT